MKYLFFTTVLFFSLSSQARCITTIFKYLDEGVEKRKQIRMCNDYKWRTSQSCKTLQCPLYNKAAQQQTLKTSNHANPGFTLCHKIDGRPIIGSYFSRANNSWRKLSLCFDDKFKEYLPIPLMIRMAAGYNKNLQPEKSNQIERESQERTMAQ